MKRILFTAALISGMFICQASLHAQTSANTLNTIEMENQTEKSTIKKMLFSYRDALNASDVEQVLPLYTQDGVFMPSSAPTSVGQEQVKAAYEFVFSSIQLKIEFSIDEIEVNGNTAFARTTSKGTTLIHASGETVPEENRELFVLQKEEGEWKIARYMFNKMN